jgi:putative PIN family toxin of toxin-antitoxin system
MRVVFDTNVLIDGFSDAYSMQARLLAAVREGKLTALITPAVTREYHKIMRRLVDDTEYKDQVTEFLATAEEVTAARVDVQIDDLDDRKFIAAAVGGKATHVVTRDRHLLDVGEVDDVRIITPQEAWALWQDETDSAGQWRGWLEGLGITQ